MANPLQSEKVWTQKNLYDQAESNYVIHLSKLLNGFENQLVRPKIKQEQLIENKETLKSKETITSQCAVAAPLPSETKKEKEKKNKRINKSKEAARTASVDSNLEAQPCAKPQLAVLSQPKLSTESEQSEKGEASLNAQPLKKSKKDRWRNRKNKNGNNKEEEVSSNSSTATQPQNGSVKGNESAPQDEKKVGSGANQSTLVSEIAKARQHIKNSLERMDGIAALAAASPGGDVLQRLATLEVENRNLVELTNLLKKSLSETQNRVQTLEDRLSGLSISEAQNKQQQNGKPAPKKDEADDDDGVDLFGSDSEEDEEAAKVREKRLAEYAAKKSKKPALIAKSSLVLDIKPWDDETDLKVMEGEVRKIICEGLLWGASKFVPVAFGIKKLTISCVVEDEKVSIDWLTEQIEQIEEYVQSVDVAAFNKI